MHHLAHLYFPKFLALVRFLGPNPAQHVLPSGVDEWVFPIFFVSNLLNIAFFCHAQPTLKILASQLFPAKSENGIPPPPGLA